MTSRVVFPISRQTNAVRPENLPSTTTRVETPDGTLWVTIAELEGMPYEFHIRIGKAGITLRAWCDAVANLINILLQRHTPLSTILQAVSNLSSDRIKTLPNGSKIRSAPEGIAYTIMLYTREKNRQKESKSGPSMEFGDLSQS